MTSEDAFPGRLAFEISVDEPALPNGQSLAYVERAYTSLVQNLPSASRQSAFDVQLRARLVRDIARAYLLERRLIERIEAIP